MMFFKPLLIDKLNGPYFFFHSLKKFEANLDQCFKYKYFLNFRLYTSLRVLEQFYKFRAI